VNVEPATPVTRTFSVNQEKLIAAHFAAGGTYTSVICAVNASSQSAQFSAAFRDDAGEPVALAIAGIGSVTAVSTLVPAKGTQCFDASNPRGATISGSVLTTADPGITVQSLFRDASADGRYYEAAVGSGGGASELVMPFDATVFQPTGSPIYTGVAIANMDPVNRANVVCAARDTEGNPIPGAVAVPPLAPGGHWADYVFPALNGLRGTLDCVSNTRIGMLGLRFLGSGAFSSLPIAGPGAVSGTSLPHFTAGGGWVSGFFVMNTSSAPGHFAISLHDDHGAPASVTIAGVGLVSTLSGAIPAHGLRYYEASGPNGQAISGSGSLVADAGITAQALFRNQAADEGYYEASAPSSTGSYEFTLPFDGTTFAPTGDPILTGIAIANLDTTQPAAIVCTARNSAGNVIPNAFPALKIDPGGHWADYRFPALAGFEGTIDCVSSTKIASIGLRFLGTSAFSSIPVIPQ
jgi:hypothetical protein